MNRSSPQANVPIAVWGAGAFLVVTAAFLPFLVQAFADTTRLVPVSGVALTKALTLALLASCAVSLIFVSRRSQPTHSQALFVLSVVTRVAISAMVVYLFQFDDELGFHQRALSRDLSEFLFVGNTAYYRLVAWLYDLFGQNILIPRVVNAVIGAYIPFLVYDIAYELTADRTVSLRALWITLALPPLIIFSGTNLKETPTIFLLTVVTRIIVTPAALTMKIAKSAAVVALLWWLRGPIWSSVPVLGAGVYLVATLGRASAKSLPLPVVIIRALVVVGLLGVVFFSVLLPAAQVNIADALQLEAESGRVAGSGARVMAYVDTQDPLAGTNMTVLFLRGLYSPTPLAMVEAKSQNGDGLVSLVVMLSWYVLFPFAIVGAVSLRQSGLALSSMLLMILFLTAAGTLVGSELGRHRIDCFSLLSVLSAVGWGARFKLGKAIHWAWWIGALVFSALWIAAR